MPGCPCLSLQPSPRFGSDGARRRSRCARAVAERCRRTHVANASSSRPLREGGDFAAEKRIPRRPAAVAPRACRAGLRTRRPRKSRPVQSPNEKSHNFLTSAPLVVSNFLVVPSVGSRGAALNTATAKQVFFRAREPSARYAGLSLAGGAYRQARRPAGGRVQSHPQSRCRIVVDRSVDCSARPVEMAAAQYRRAPLDELVKPAVAALVCFTYSYARTFVTRRRTCRLDPGWDGVNRHALSQTSNAASLATPVGAIFKGRQDIRRCTSSGLRRAAAPFVRAARPSEYVKPLCQPCSSGGCRLAAIVHGEYADAAERPDGSCARTASSSSPPMEVSCVGPLG